MTFLGLKQVIEDQEKALAYLKFLLENIDLDKEALIANISKTAQLEDRISYLESSLVSKEETIRYQSDKIDDLLDQNSFLQKELDKERKILPCDGVWLVQKNVKDSQCMVKLGEVPDPIKLATVWQHESAISKAVVECWELYHEKGRQSPREVTEAILKKITEGL